MASDIAHAVCANSLSAGALMIGTTVLFALVAWKAPLPRETCEGVPQIIRYFPEQEVKIVQPAINWRWPIAERGTPIVAQETPVAPATEEQPNKHIRHLRRHWRNWR
jgi:hypothetical protein